MGGQVPRDGFHGLCVHPCGAAYDFEVVLVREVEEKDIVCLAIDAIFDGVRLVGDERREDTEVPHAGNDVVPVGFAQVEVSFFREKERSAEFPVLEAVDEFAEKVFNYDLAVYVACVPQIDD